MELDPYEINNYDEYINSIVMIPEKNNENGFYKIIKSTQTYFLVKKMKCETKTKNLLHTDDSTLSSKTYEAIISNEFDSEIICKKIKKTSINHKYPIIICSVVQYEI